MDLAELRQTWIDTLSSYGCHTRAEILVYLQAHPDTTNCIRDSFIEAFKEGNNDSCREDKEMVQA